MNGPRLLTVTFAGKCGMKNIVKGVYLIGFSVAMMHLFGLYCRQNLQWS